MHNIQHQAVNQSFSHMTNAELERFCYSSLPNIPIKAQEELLARFGAFLPAAEEPLTKYK